MGVERQQGGFYQPSLFEGIQENPRPARMEKPAAYLFGARSHKRSRRRTQHEP